MVHSISKSYLSLKVERIVSQMKTVAFQKEVGNEASFFISRSILGHPELNHMYCSRKVCLRERYLKISLGSV